MRQSSRKRAVLSCIACYRRKQKCNRRLPCNHCVRRRHPEECSYYKSDSAQSALLMPQTDDGQDDENPDDSLWQDHYVGNEMLISSVGLEASISNAHSESPGSSVAKVFGYFEDSEFNALALIRKRLTCLRPKFGLEEEHSSHKSNVIPQDFAKDVQQEFDRIPDRRVLDFLVRCYMDLVNWVDQVVCPAKFLSQYQEWKARGALSSIDDVEFAVLLLRLCSHAAKFLPSPSYPVDRVRSMLLGDIRKQCDSIGDRLAKTCTSLDPRGSLVRVQHLIISGLGAQCEGKNDTFWETIGHAVLAAQKLGICQEFPAPIRPSLCWSEEELRRSTLCNLYVWDSVLSRQLDRMPFLPDNAVDCAGGFLVQATTEAGDAGTPDLFTERLLQARLARFWRSFGLRQGTDYDMAIAEERFDKFCSEYLASLPSAFSLPPNKQWDGRLPKLPLQRQLLYISIFDCVCWNFRSVLLIEADRVRNLPRYKQVQLASQKRILAVSALNVLSAAVTLHNMLGASYTRHPGIIIHMFEAAVLVGSLCIDPDFPGAEYGGCTQNIASLGCFNVDITKLTRGHCIKSVQDAAGRLRKLADVSEMADAGVRTLATLTDKIVLDGAGETVDIVSNWHATMEDLSCILPFIDAADYGNAVDSLEFEHNHPDQNHEDQTHPDHTVPSDNPPSAEAWDYLNFNLQLETDYSFEGGPDFS